LSADFHRIIHRALPAPVGFRDRVTRYRHFIAACSAVEEKTPRWDILGTIIVVAGIVAANIAIIVPAAGSVASIAVTVAVARRNPRAGELACKPDSVPR
jgi:hypothetical protein